MERNKERKVGRKIEKGGIKVKVVKIEEGTELDTGMCREKKEKEREKKKAEESWIEIRRGKGGRKIEKEEKKVRVVQVDERRKGKGRR